MLAYLFWHRPSPAVGIGEYESFLASFHQSLHEHPTPGFISSAAFALSAAPWLPGEGNCYEDWYLLESSAALDPLNDGAISAPRQHSHDRVAAVAQSGAAGLYSLRLGDEAVSRTARSVWFAKPAGMTYPELFSLLEPFSRQGASLWGRQMVLGPAPEFCLQSDGDIDLPAKLETVTISRRRIYPSLARSRRTSNSGFGRVGRRRKAMPVKLVRGKTKLPQIIQVGVAGIGAQAMGALAVGAIGIGAFAIARLAIKKLAIQHQKIDKLEIGELVVRKLTVEELDVVEKRDLPL